MVVSGELSIHSTLKYTFAREQHLIDAGAVAACPEQHSWTRAFQPQREARLAGSHSPVRLSVCWSL